MNNIWLIAKREYLERVRSKAYRISTLVIPLAMAGIFGIGAVSGRLSGSRSIVVTSDDPALAASAATELSEKRTSGASGPGARNSGDGESPFHVEVRPGASPADISALNQEVESKQIDGYLWLKTKPGAVQPEAIFVSAGSADAIGQGRMTDAIERAIVHNELLKHGEAPVDIQTLLKPVDLKTMEVKAGQLVPADSGKRFWGAYAMAFTLYFAVVFYGVNVAQSVAAEKTSRVFEVLLASVEPETLMTGKLLGVAAAGLTQMAIWIAALLYFSATSMASTLMEGGLAAYGVTPIQLVFLFVYFILGFFFYSALSAAIGAAVNQESDVQQFNMLIVLPQVIGIVMIVYVLRNPGAWPVVLLSLFPPVTHIVMMLRIAAMTVPWWQLGLSVVIMLASIRALLWLASRIYRVGILMYGKQATVPEIMRWIRYK